MDRRLLCAVTFVGYELARYVCCGENQNVVGSSCGFHIAPRKGDATEGQWRCLSAFGVFGEKMAKTVEFRCIFYKEAG